MARLERLDPIWTAPLFPELGAELVSLLRSLSAEDWHRPTVCSAWSVRDVAAHLLDTALRRVSADRDDFVAGPEEGEVHDYASLIGFLDRLNAEWVRSSRRLSPALLTDQIEWVEARLAETLSGLDPDAPARFPVSWAGEDESKLWFDVARELTERWIHHQQIRLATGRAPLAEPGFSRPVFEALLRALPNRYREVEAARGSCVALAIEGEERYEFALRLDPEGWQLLAGKADDPAASIVLDEQSAWLLLSKGKTGEAAKADALTTGPDGLVGPFFDVLAVMA